MREFITSADFKSMILSASAAIENHKQQINDLNVFPVPDGDTGTNMSLTIGSAAAELRKSEPATIGKAAEITASALLRGARGNSGVILSLLFRGIARSLKDKENATAREYASAMVDGVDAAYKAVMKPAEGTILTVSRLASAAAREFAEVESNDIELMLSKALEVGYEALDDTINLNPVLKKAGVIDAGGKGYLIILDGMLASLRGEAVTSEPVPVIGERREKAEFSDFDTNNITFGYCTEFIVSRDNDKDPMLLWDFLGGLGDSAVVVDDDEIIKVHVHTNEPGVVLTEALTYGSLLTVKIENMREQHTEMVYSEANELKPVRTVAEPEKKYGAVAVCVGSGIEAVFADLGVDFTITGGQTMNPSTEDILAEIDRTPAEIVYVFPNNSNIIMTAEQCIPLSEKKVIVIPTKTIPQGISAMLAMNTSLETDECTAAMLEAIENVHSLQVTYAARDSDYDGCDIHEGDYLPFLEKRLLGTERDFDGVYASICTALDEYAPEFITVFYGEDVSEEQANCCFEALSSHFGEAEVSLVYGGQPVYYYMISAE